MPESRRDSGLIRAMGPWELAAGIISMVVGAGIFAVPGALAACVGPWAPLAFLGCGVAVGAVAICFAEGGSRIPTSGGVYGYIDAAFGPLTAYVAGTLFLVAGLLACGGIAAALADVVVSAFPGRLTAPLHAAVIIGVIGGIAMVNLGGVARGAHLVGATTALKLIPLAVFVLVGAAAMRGANFVHGLPGSTAGLGRAVILALFAFVGMETSLCASGEVAQPNRTIPRALAIAMLTVTFLYVAVQTVAQGILGAALARSTVPLADAMAQVHPALRVLMLAGAALSMFGWISSDILGGPRQLFAFARDGLLPRALARLHPRTHAPQAAILCYAALAMIIALTGTFTELAVLSTLASAGLYIAGCAAAWLLAHRGVALAGTPLRFRWLGTAAAIGVSAMLTLIALASVQEIVGLIMLIAVSALLFTLRTRGLFARD